MATQLQIRRGTSSQVAAFTGAEGEIVVNTTNDSIHVNDGSTAGGFELARVDGSNWNVTNNISTTGSLTAASLVVDTTTLVVDATNNRVGIGTSSPSAKLTLNDAGQQVGIDFKEAGTTRAHIEYDGTIPALELGTNGAANVVLKTSNTERMRIDQNGELTLGNPSGGSALQLDVSATGSDGVDIKGTYYTGSYGPIKFHTGGSERMRIDQAGQIFFQKSSEDIGVAGMQFLTNGLTQLTASGTPLYLNRLSSDGEIVSFRKDGTTVGSIGVVSGDRMYFSTADGLGLQFDKDNNRIVPVAADGSTYNNNVSLGSSGLEFKHLYLSGGAYLGGTAAANKLDDYEEGTWTPTALNYDGTMTVDSASYEKIGRQVTLRARLDFDGTSDGSQILLTIPFNHLSGSPGSTGVANGEGAINVMIKNASGRIEGRKSDGSSTSYTDLANKTIEFTYIYATAS